ncbi:MAG: TonB-dependent receptor [Deltaproteobacteria bacterium]|jgi:hemoglobin/transferrin/lactoferrin receptor protein|nr:TonB-dependent receptor [Deltaproteobacteria bacterium]
MPRNSTRPAIRGRTRGARLAVISAAALACAALLQAAAPADLRAQAAEGTVRVAPVYVTAARVLQNLMEVPMGVSVLTSEDLEREPYTSITDALAQLPGVMIDGGSVARPGAARISIRGESYGRTLILIDGVRAIDKESSENVITIDSSQIERIEVIKGPGSVLYGSDAMGGVVIITTKKGGEKPIGLSQTIVADSSTASVDTQTAVFGRSGGFNWRVSASGVDAHDRRVPKDSRDGSSAATSNYRTRYFSAQVGYDWGGNSLTVRADRYKNKSFYANGQSAAQDNTIMSLAPNDRDTVTATLTLADLTRNLKKLTLLASYQKSEKRVVSDFNNPGMGPYWQRGHNYSEQKQITLNAQSEWEFGPHRLATGVDFSLDDVLVRPESIPYTIMAVYSYTETKTKRQSVDFYAQDEWAVTRDLSLTGGLRLMTVRDSVKYRRQDGVALPKIGSKSTSKLVGGIGAVYSGLDGWAFRANYTMGYRYPSIRQLLTGSAGHGMASALMYPNPNLKPETSNNYEIGARHQSGNWDIDLSAFLSDAKNYIHSLTINGVSTWMNRNKVRTIGAEASLGYTFDAAGFRLNPYGTGTWLKRRITLLDGRSSSATNTPPLEVRLGMKFEKPFGGNLFYGDVYARMALKTEYDITEAVFNGAVNNIAATKTKAEAWQTGNVTLGLKGGDDHRYNVSISFRNIFNQTYHTINGTNSLPEPGFHAVMSVGFEF